MDRHQRPTMIQSADGTEIGVAVVGSGPPLVFVHGAWNWADHWLGVAELLADAHECSVLERRGRASSGDGTDYSFDREIEDIAAVLSAAGPGASLFGHSSGAIYALEAARRFSVARLILYEPPLIWAERGDPGRLVERIRALVSAGSPRRQPSSSSARRGGSPTKGWTSSRRYPNGSRWWRWRR